MAQASNQYFPMLPSFPSMAPGYTASGGGGGGNPYQVPSYGGTMPSSTNQRWDPNQFGASMQSSSGNLGHGIIATGLQYPGLSQDFANYLFSQVGQGMTPFNLGTPLPTGGTTQPGQLTAGLNPLLQQLMSFFTGKGGGSMPGANALSTIANQGISALPEWQAMVAAMQPNIEQNQAMMREQFAGMGGLAGTPFGTAESNFASQTALGQNALLAQLQQQNILQGQMPAAQYLQSQGQNLAGGLQALDQQAIQNMLQEFIRVAPQNNPMMPYLMGMSSMYPPTNQTKTTGQSAMDWVSTLLPLAGLTNV